jgi:peptidoglycan L-alanyl-D-glutamate endopeptidase CwlK
MTLSDTQWEFLQDVAKLIQYAAARGYKMTGGELYRTAEQQAIYLQKKMSYAKESQHQKKLAVDLNIFKHNKPTYDRTDIKPLGDYWESLNRLNRWGGNFKSLDDAGHFERIER